jgi:integrase
MLASFNRGAECAPRCAPKLLTVPGAGAEQVDKLSDVKLRNLSQPGKHFDGGGLYLEVTPAGGRYWRLKYRFAGKEKRLAFGVYPEVSLKAARERRAAARAVLDLGDDPSVVKRRERAQTERDHRNTFRTVAGAWIEHQSGKWAAGTREAIRVSLETHVMPKLGELPLVNIRPRDVAAVIRKIEAGGAGETAGRVLQRVRAVFRYAVVHELIDSNPLLDLLPSELLKPRQAKHRAAMADKDLPKFLADFEAFDGEPTTKAALRLLMLTVLRPGELRGLRWSEVDTDRAELRIAAERMKMKASHIVPLSRQALDVIESMRPLSGERDLVFPSPYYPGQMLSENTLNSALAAMGYKGKHSAHGFRALFSTVANESGKRPDVIERQLAHKERNEVRAAYHRAEYLAERASLMQWWADHLDQRRKGAVIRPLKRA